ncbi:MAG TPA: response regulator [Terriglobales bacterium]|nr:response regulator [Terriglobales bacterium]
MAESKIRPRVLFVDDEPSIRLTLPPVLQESGFEVHVSESVSDALFEINTNPYDVLISDLNIGEEGDGFLVVSAMRHIQPKCTNFILTGYPAFETALQAIQNQVDDYLVKPVEIESLVKSVRDKVDSRKSGPMAGWRLSSLMKENFASFADGATEASKKKNSSALQNDELSRLLKAMVEQLAGNTDELNGNATQVATDYGKRIKKDGLPLSSIVSGLQRFADKAYGLIQTHLTTADMSTLISDLRKFNHHISQLTEKSLDSYSRRKAA